MRQRLFPFFQFFRRTMNLESDQIDHGEQLRERSANVIEMRENAVGVFVSFAAEKFVAVNSERVEKILFLGRSFLNKPRKPSFDRVQFPGMHFEIRMQTDEV